MALPRIHLSAWLVLTDNRRSFADCGFVETTHDAHPGYADLTFVSMEKRLHAAAECREQAITHQLEHAPAAYGLQRVYHLLAQPMSVRRDP